MEQWPPLCQAAVGNPYTTTGDTTHNIARAIEECGLDIRSVTALTRSDVAEDTFRLVDANGAAPREEGPLGQLMMRLRSLA